MAVLGRWTGAPPIAILPTTSWAAPNGMFPTQARNDSSAYSFNSTISTLTLPSSGLADGYLLIGAYEFEDSSNGRHNPQGKIVQASGTGNFVGGPTGGYNRDTSEDRSFVRCWAFVDNPSASSTYQFQWKRDTDAPTGGIIISSFEVIPLYYSNIAMYTSNSAALYGGTTPNVVTTWTTVTESNTAAIERVSDVITVKGDNKKYLAFASQFFEGRGGRTQRWHGMDVDGVEEHAAKAYSYYRSTANDESGDMFTHFIETSTANVTFEQTCYRGAGVGAGQGGADADGSTPTVGDHTFIFIELNDSAEGFHSVDGTGGVDLNVTGPVDQSVCRTTDITFNDSASFTRASDTAMNCEQAMDVLLGANISAAQEVVATTSRWTARAHFTLNGTEDSHTVSGDYARNNQGTIDTFGWSANLMSFMAVAANDDIGVSVQELSGGEDGGQYEVQPGWSGFWGINLDSLESSGASYTITAESGSVSIAGSDANTEYGRVLSADSTSYSVTGQDATLTVASNTSITAESGSFSITGQDSNLEIGYLLDAQSGNVSISGTSANLEIGYRLDAESTNYSISGTNADLYKGYELQAESGSYVVNGTDAVLNTGSNPFINAEAGSYSVLGSSAGLFRNYILSAESGFFSYSGSEANLIYSGLEYQTKSGGVDIRARRSAHKVRERKKQQLKELEDRIFYKEPEVENDQYEAPQITLPDFSSEISLLKSDIKNYSEEVDQKKRAKKARALALLIGDL